MSHKILQPKSGDSGKPKMFKSQIISHENIAEPSS
jgi:hypothetical protein